MGFCRCCHSGGRAALQFSGQLTVKTVCGRLRWPTVAAVARMRPGPHVRLVRLCADAPLTALTLTHSLVSRDSEESVGVNGVNRRNWRRWFVAVATTSHAPHPSWPDDPGPLRPRPTRPIAGRERIRSLGVTTPPLRRMNSTNSRWSRSPLVRRTDRTPAGPRRRTSRTA